MKLTASTSTGKSSVILLPSRKKSGWLRTAFLQASCLSQSAVAAGAFGVDFFDPSAVRAANRKVLLSSAETPSQDGASGKPAHELAIPFPAPV
jgi:hypothetical protein